MAHNCRRLNMGDIIKEIDASLFFINADRKRERDKTREREREREGLGSIRFLCMLHHVSEAAGLIWHLDIYRT